MVSLSLSLSRTPSLASSLAEANRSSYESEEFIQVERPISAASGSLKSSSASTYSISRADEEDMTVTTAKPTAKPTANGVDNGDQSVENLRLLAISSHMTELSYSVSDIQTRIFEIQELRHQSQSSENSSSSSSSVIDQALMNLDERLESVNRGMKTVNDALHPYISQTPTPQPENGHVEDGGEVPVLLRKHATLVSEWESIQDETEVLREELKEDKWLTVFRTVSEQADGMMSSLEKAVQRCQDFIWRAHRRAASAEESPRSSFSNSPKADRKAPLTYETFLTLQDSFEAKKKHYMPATSKVLSIIDKGVQDRVTKNGECLRRHAESTQRWKNLRERIARTDSEMEKVRRLFLPSSGSDANDDAESVMSEMTSKSSNHKQSSNSYGQFGTPPSSESSRGRATNAMGTLSRSMSPLRKFAKRLSKVGRATPTQSPSPAPGQGRSSKVPATEPARTLRKRQSLFPLRNPSSTTNAVTPDRPMHKHSQSFAPESPTLRRQSEAAAALANGTFKPKWNSSTKVQDEGGKTIKRKPSANSMRVVSAPGGIPPVPPLPGHARSPSRSSVASSRPWSPITISQGSTTRSSISRPPSRSSPGSQSGSRPSVRSRISGAQIPTPAFWRSTSGASEASFDDESPVPSSSLMQRLSPTNGTSFPARSKTPLGTSVPYPRPPSRSMIPVPKFSFSSASRPTSAMSDYIDDQRPGSSMSFRSSVNRAQTPESALRSRVAQLPFFSPQGDSPSSSYFPQTPSATIRRTSSRLPPSSFRDAPGTAPPVPPQPRSVSSSSRPSSRPSSRAGDTYTPQSDNAQQTGKYVPVNTNDPLDSEIAAIVNAFPHGLLVERVDPPLPPRSAPPGENEEVKAQYAFTNQIARKVVTCRLLTMGRVGSGANIKNRKKVMCRVGGGWQELQLYILNRQAGI